MPFFDVIWSEYPIRQRPEEVLLRDAAEGDDEARTELERRWAAGIEDEDLEGPAGDGGGHQGIPD